MIHLTYNNDLASTINDGLGAQIQRILSIFLIAKKHGWQYLHSPILSPIIQPETLDRFNKLIALPPSPPLPPQIKTVQMSAIDVEKIKTYETKCIRPTLFKITFAHNYINTNIDILDKPFPYHFDWIAPSNKAKPFVAVHIRRGPDVTPDKNAVQFVSLSFYSKCINNIRKLTKNECDIHLFSQGEIKQELLLCNNNNNGDLGDITYHIDYDIVNTFKAMVNADILVTGCSALSYAALMLRVTNGKFNNFCVPYYHTIPNKAQCIRDPDQCEFKLF